MIQIRLNIEFAGARKKAPGEVCRPAEAAGKYCRVKGRICLAAPGK
jgi:hypothetical protein